MGINKEIHYVIFAQSKDCGVTTAGHYWAAARKQLQSNGVFYAVHANGWACNNGICHAITKQLLHCNRGTAFSMWSMLICYKQGKLGAVVTQLLQFSHCELLLLEAGS
jgi:hypothetical protein